MPFRVMAAQHHEDLGVRIDEMLEDLLPGVAVVGVRVREMAIDQRIDIVVR